MHSCVVLVHPIIALFRLVECDAERVVPAQNFTAIVKPGRKRHLRTLLAEFREERKRSSKIQPRTRGQRRAKSVVSKRSNSSPSFLPNVDLGRKLWPRGNRPWTAQLPLTPPTSCSNRKHAHFPLILKKGISWHTQESSAQSVAN